MSNKKLFSAREAAQAVLNKAKALLEDSSLMKAEKLKKDMPAPAPSPSPTNSAASGIMAGFNSMGAGGGGAGSTSMPKSEMKKYETENKKPAGNRYGKIEKDQKPTERDYNEYEVKSGNSKDSDGPRLARQVSPSGNPAEEAEGNNKDGGMEPEYEFKDKVSKELAKEKASHMVKSQSGMHTVVYKSAAFEKSENLEKSVSDAGTKGIHRSTLEQGTSKAGANVKQLSGTGFKSTLAPREHKRVLGEIKEMSSKDRSGMGKAEALEKGDWKKIHDKLKREGYSEESANKIDGSIKAKLGKGENPDEKQDAELGEKVEHDVEEHHKEMGNEVDEEGQDMAKPGDKMEGQTESNVIPRLIGSAKLSKFMEHMHSKRKAAQGAQSQAPAAVGQDASGAPPQGSTQAGQSDNSRPKMQPTDGDVNKSESSFDKLKHKIENKEGYSEKGAAGAAYEAGVKKYGKAGMAAKAAAGRKK